MTAHVPGVAERPDRVGLLLGFEGGMRQCTDADALGHYLVNEIPALANVAQVFLLRPLRGRLRLTHVTGMAKPEPQAPQVIALEKHAAGLADAKACCTGLSSIGAPETPMAHHFGLYTNLVHVQGGSAGLLLLAASRPFTAADQLLAARIGQAAGHALSVFRPRRTKLSANGSIWLGATAILLGAMFLPVRFSALAPAEIIAANPIVIASPLDGVIAELAVAPNQAVTAGALLARFEDTDLKGRLTVAERAVDVADARARRARQGAGLSSDLRGELAIAEAELAIAAAERDQALALASRTLIHAPSAGLAIYSRREDWTGRPVATGEKIMQIAAVDDPAFRIELGLVDALALEGDGEARIFLDAEVLHPVSAKISEAGHLAEPVAGGRMAFPVKALPTDPDDRKLRIGLRGTAQIYGPQMRLGHYIFRRPLSLFRQKFGL